MTEHAGAKRSDDLKETLARSEVHEQWWTDYLQDQNDSFYSLAVDRIVELLNAPDGATILDAGCGVGDFSIKLARHGFNVSAIDFSPHALEEAGVRVQKSALSDKINLRQDNLLDLQIPDNQFDYVFCWGVLMHIHDVETAIAQLCRVAKPGATIVISEGNMYSLESMLMRWTKKLLGRQRERLVWTPAGLEFWSETPAGDLLTRQASIKGISDLFAANGAQLEKRLAGEFSELYCRTSSAGMRSFIHGLNRFWFRYLGFARPAFGNLLFFQKTGS